MSLLIILVSLPLIPSKIESIFCVGVLGSRTEEGMLAVSLGLLAA